MSYQALYRKYRPTNFDEVYGQDIVKRILINSIKNNKIAHAYLFYGPRGTGKTSIAKLFSRTVNCENIDDYRPCEKCTSCIESKSNDCVDIIEIDAASNNGVDDVRDLKNKISLVPNVLKYKVYIIDEVHMLSSGAFNALLKTLEEPPEHVIFILATTEIYSVPATIVSRCQVLEFKNIDNKNLFNRINDICSSEKIKIDEEAIKEVVKNSNGGLRDAIGLLDKLNAYCDKKITADDVREVVGVASDTDIIDFINSYIAGNQVKLLKYIDEFFESSKNITKIVDEIIYKLENYIIRENKNSYIDYANDFVELNNKLSYSTNKKMVFELFILDKTNVRDNNTTINVLEEVKETVDQKEEVKVDKPIDNKFIDIRINNAFATANKQELIDIKDKWKELENFVFDPTVGSNVCDLVDSNPVVASTTYLIIVSKYDSVADKINQNVTDYEKIVSNKLNCDIKLVSITNDLWKKKKDEFVENKKNNIKYELIEEEVKEVKKTKKKESKNDAFMNKAKDLFGDLI